jgi:hypothetical protein
MTVCLVPAAIAKASSIPNPILPPSDGWSSDLSDCVLAEFKAASGLEFRSALVAEGPAYAQDDAGADVKTKAEFIIAGELTSGQWRGFKVHFVSNDGTNWLFYQDSDSRIGVYGTNMDSVVEVYEFRSGAMVFRFDLDKCRNFIGH